MHHNSWKRILSIALVTIATCGLGHAHNLYVLLEKQEEGSDLVDVIFEHSPYPGKGTYNQPLMDRGETWVQTLGSDEKTPLDLKEAERLGKKFLQTETDTTGARAIVHSCEWGVYKGRMNYFFGKWIEASSPEELSQLANTPELPLDLLVTHENDRLKVTVVFEGKPLPNKKIWIWAPGTKEKTQTTGEDGSITIPDLQSGIYSFASVHFIAGPTGEFEGEPWEGINRGTTTNLRWPLD